MPSPTPLRVPACHRPGAVYGLGVGRETRRKCVYSSLKNSLVCAGSSPAQRGPSAVRGTKGCIPGGCQRKEGKKRREVAPQPVTPGPATCRDRVGSPRRCLRCVFSLNTGIWGSLAPGRRRLPPAPLPAAVALGSVPSPGSRHDVHVPNRFRREGGKPRVLPLPGDGKEN